MTPSGIVFVYFSESSLISVDIQRLTDKSNVDFSADDTACNQAGYN